MKAFPFVLTLVLFAFPAFAEDRDPRIQKAMRDEQVSAQQFCRSFVFEEESPREFEGIEACLKFAGARFGTSYDLARSVKQDDDEEGSLWEAHLKFCGVVGKYAKPDMNSRKACENWNREWDQLFGFARTPGVPSESLVPRIEKVAKYRFRFCDSLAERSDPFFETSRVGACRKYAEFATATDRAILLGEF